MSRNIIIYPNRGTTGATDQPYITFSGASAGTINLIVEDDGSITFDGDTGSLFGISDSKDGLLSSVNDVSGLPILAVYDNDYINMGKWDEPTLIVSGQTWNIIGGSGHTVNNGVTKSAIIGGEGITATTSDTVYVPNLVIPSLPSESVLGTDANGLIIAGTGGGGGAGTVGGTGTTNTITKWSSTTGLTDSQITDDGTTVNITGNTTISGVTQVNGNETIRKKGVTTLSSGATVTMDLDADGATCKVTLGGNSNIDLTNVEDGDMGTLIIIQDTVGSRTITLNNVNGGAATHKVVSGGGGSITLTATANAEDMISFVYDAGTSTVYWNSGFNYT